MNVILNYTETVINLSLHPQWEGEVLLIVLLT